MAFSDAILLMKGSPFFAVIFFMMLMLLGIDSEFGTLEAAISPFFDAGIIKSMSKELFTGKIAWMCAKLIFPPFRLFCSSCGIKNLVTCSFIFYVYSHCCRRHVLSWTVFSCREWFLHFPDFWRFLSHITLAVHRVFPMCRNYLDLWIRKVSITNIIRFTICCTISMLWKTQVQISQIIRKRFQRTFSDFIHWVLFIYFITRSWNKQKASHRLHPAHI